MYEYLAERNGMTLADRTHVQPLALLISQSNQTAVLWHIVLPIEVWGLLRLCHGLVPPRLSLAHQLCNAARAGRVEVTALAEVDGGCPVCLIGIGTAWALRRLCSRRRGPSLAPCAGSTTQDAGACRGLPGGLERGIHGMVMITTTTWLHAVYQCAKGATLGLGSALLDPSRTRLVHNLSPLAEQEPGHRSALLPQISCVPIFHDCTHRHTAQVAVVNDAAGKSRPFAHLPRGVRLQRTIGAYEVHLVPKERSGFGIGLHVSSCRHSPKD